MPESPSVRPWLTYGIDQADMQALKNIWNCALYKHVKLNICKQARKASKTVTHAFEWWILLPNIINIIIIIIMTSHAFTPPPSEFERDVVIISYHGRSFGLIVISGARLGVASGRISRDWVNGSSSERVGMRHEFGFQFEFRQLLQFSQ